MGEEEWQDHEGGIRIKRVARPRHPEQLSGKESGRFQAFWVRLPVLVAKGEEPIMRDYCARAPHPGDAATLCEKMWNIWEKNERGLKGREYPEVDGYGGVVCLDEGDWAEKLREARAHRHRFQGMPENPSVFTWWKEDRPRPQLVLPPGGLVVPVRAVPKGLILPGGK